MISDRAASGKTSQVIDSKCSNSFNSKHVFVDGVGNLIISQPATAARESELPAWHAAVRGCVRLTVQRVEYEIVDPAGHTCIRAMSHGMSSLKIPASLLTMQVSILSAQFINELFLQLFDYLHNASNADYVLKRVLCELRRMDTLHGCTCICRRHSSICNQRSPWQRPSPSEFESAKAICFLQRICGAQKILDFCQRTYSHD